MANDIMKKELCPVCKYELETCQCLYSGSAHPDRHKRYEVVIDNLYLLTETQLQHIIFLQQFWRASYSDDEKDKILQELKDNFKFNKIDE